MAEANPTRTTGAVAGSITPVNQQMANTSQTGAMPTYQSMANNSPSFDISVGNLQNQGYNLTPEMPNFLKSGKRTSDSEHASNIGALNAAGITDAFINQIMPNGYGDHLNPTEAAQIWNAASEQGILKPSEADVKKAQIESLTSSQFAFDPNQYLPGIQQTATNIFAPQQAQLEAIRMLQGSQYEQAAEDTNEAYDAEFRSAVENMNRRGSYFSGGAIEQEGDIRSNQSRALSQLGLQAQAADFGNLAQQAILQQEKSSYITDALFNTESSMWNRWRDARDTSIKGVEMGWNMYTDERNFARDVFVSDRDYDWSVEQAEKQWGFTEDQFDLQKDQFNLNVEKWDYSTAMAELKKAAPSNYLPGLSDAQADIAGLDASSGGSGGSGGSNFDPNEYGTEITEKPQEQVRQISTIDATLNNYLGTPVQPTKTQPSIQPQPSGSSGSGMANQPSSRTNPRINYGY